MSFTTWWTKKITLGGCEVLAWRVMVNSPGRVAVVADLLPAPIDEKELKQKVAVGRPAGSRDSTTVAPGNLSMRCNIGGDDGDVMATESSFSLCDSGWLVTAGSTGNAQKIVFIMRSLHKT